MQFVAVCWCVADFLRGLESAAAMCCRVFVYCSVLPCVAVCCHVLQCVAVRQCVAELLGRVWSAAATCYSVLVCYSVLQCVAVR